MVVLGCVVGFVFSDLASAFLTGIYVVRSSLRLYLEIWGLLARNYPSDPTYFGNALQTVMNGSAGRCLFWESSSRNDCRDCLFKTCQKLRVGEFGLFCFVFCMEPFTITRDVFPTKLNSFLVSNDHPDFFFFRIGWWNGFNTRHLAFVQVVIFGRFRCPKTFQRYVTEQRN